MEIIHPLLPIIPTKCDNSDYLLAVTQFLYWYSIGPIDINNEELIKEEYFQYMFDCFVNKLFDNSNPMIGYNTSVTISAVLDNSSKIFDETYVPCIHTLFQILKHFCNELYVCMPTIKTIRFLFNTDSIVPSVRDFCTNEHINAIKSIGLIHSQDGQIITDICGIIRTVSDLEFYDILENVKIYELLTKAFIDLSDNEEALVGLCDAIDSLKQIPSAIQICFNNANIMNILLDQLNNLDSNIYLIIQSIRIILPLLDMLEQYLFASTSFNNNSTVETPRTPLKSNLLLQPSSSPLPSPQHQELTRQTSSIGIDFRKCFIDHNTYERILELCMNKWNEYLLIDDCIYILQWMCKNRKYKIILINEEIIDEIIKIIDMYNHIKRTVLNAGGLLTSLIDSDDEIGELLIEKGVRESYIESFDNELHNRSRTIILAMWIDLISELNKYVSSEYILQNKQELDVLLDLFKNADNTEFIRISILKLISHLLFTHRKDEGLLLYFYKRNLFSIVKRGLKSTEIDVNILTVALELFYHYAEASCILLYSLFCNICI